VTFFAGKNVVVTGGTGFIGSHLVETLCKEGAHVRVVAHSRPPLKAWATLKEIEIVWHDLTIWEECKKAVEGADIVFHLAASAGGIGQLAALPATTYTKNMLMNTQMLEAARTEDVEKYLFVSSVQVYPAHYKLPISESEAWKGIPEATGAAYGWVKLMGELQAQLYAKEYGMKIATVRPFNVYGPRDNFDLRTARVIPATIRKALERHDPFHVWGSGEPTRDFIYVADVVKGMLLAVEKYAVADPVNLGTGKEVKIKDLVTTILRLAGHNPSRIIFDKEKPTGRARVVTDIRKAKKVMGFEAKISLEEGLKETINWYRVQMG
jgi:GDP-L-fucose synthase